jgi:large subunit ribosomal protein L21
MYAIVEIAKKQYKIEEGDSIEVEKLSLPAKRRSFTLDKVLMICDGKDVSIGRPYLKEAKVSFEILGNFRTKKIIAYKYRRRKNFHWKKGHRQVLTKLKVKEIKI